MSDRVTKLDQLILAITYSNTTTVQYKCKFGRKFGAGMFKKHLQFEDFEASV